MLKNKFIIKDRMIETVNSILCLPHGGFLMTSMVDEMALEPEWAAALVNRQRKGSGSHPYRERSSMGLGRFEEMGIPFAFPTRTVHVKGVGGGDTGDPE